VRHDVASGFLCLQKWQGANNKLASSCRVSSRVAPRRVAYRVASCHVGVQLTTVLFNQMHYVMLVLCNIQSDPTLSLHSPRLGLALFCRAYFIYRFS